MTQFEYKTDRIPLSYARVLLKISGEALMGEQNYGIDVNVARSVAEELKAVHELGCSGRRGRRWGKHLSRRL